MKHYMKAVRFSCVAISLCTASLLLSAPGDRTLVTVSSGGVLPNDACWAPSISADGRYVCFISGASRLEYPELWGYDVWVRDRLLKKTRRITRRYDWHLYLESTSISADGRYIAYGLNASMFGNSWDVYVYDQVTDVTTHESASTEDPSNRGSQYPVLSPDGRSLCFTSTSKHLVEPDLNDKPDIFCRDRVTGEFTLVTVSSTGQQGNGDWSCAGATSKDGRYIAFLSDSTNLVAEPTQGTQIFLRDRVAGTTTLVSMGLDGAMPNGPSQQLDLGGNPGRPAISANGRYVAFQSHASNLVPGDTNGVGDIFVRDLQLGITKRVSVSSLGVQQDAPDGKWSGSREMPSMSADGRFISFTSNSGNLFVGENNRRDDGFVFDRLTETIQAVLDDNGVPERYGSSIGPMSANGKFLLRWIYRGRITDTFPIYADELRLPNQITGLSLLRSNLAGKNATMATIQVKYPFAFGEGSIEVTSSTPSITVPPVVYLPTGTTTKSFPVRVTPVAAASVEAVTARYGNQTMIVNLTLGPLMPSAFEFSPHPVVGGNTTLARLVMNGVAGPGGKLVSISDNNDFCATPSTAMVPAGAPQVVFTIATLPVTRTQYVTVTAQVAEGSKTGLFVIRP